MNKKQVNFSITENSHNRKTGPITVLKSEMVATCPDSCSWKKNGCYAKYGPITIAWSKINKSGISLNEVCLKIKKLPRKSLLRLFESGDLPGNGKYRLYKDACIQLAKSCKSVVAFGYSHYRPNKHNLPIFMEIAKYCTINLSVDNLKQADEMIKTGLPVVTVVPKDSPSVFYTEGGNKVVVCPFEQVKKDENGNIVKRKVENCMTCASGSGKGPLCAWQKRDFIIGFKPHGSGAKYLNTKMNQYEFSYDDGETNFVGVIS